MGAMTQATTTEVFIADAAATVRERLRELLTAIPGVSVVGDADTAAGAIAGILHTRPGCVLLDYQLGAGTAADVLCAVRPRVPDAAYLVLTNRIEPQYRRACMAAGADDFLDKSNEFGRIGDVIRRLECPSASPTCY
jgi:DNA-binding NarL/FixJ family response regulator